jgi:hypothetical protein
LSGGRRPRLTRRERSGAGCARGVWRHNLERIFNDKNEPFWRSA